MKHLNLEMERLEQRIAPGGLTGGIGLGLGLGVGGNAGANAEGTGEGTYDTGRSGKSSKSKGSGS
jgi:hypothetical protein